MSRRKSAAASRSWPSIGSQHGANSYVGTSGRLCGSIEKGEGMHALVLEEFNGPFIPKEVSTPQIGPYEALVRVRNVGVCGTDLKIRAGRMGLNVLPLIMGHE